MKPQRCSKRRLETKVAGYKGGDSTRGLAPRGQKCQDSKLEPEFFTFSRLDKCARITPLIYIFVVFNQKIKAVKKKRSWANGQLKIHFKLHAQAKNSNHF